MAKAKAKSAPRKAKKMVTVSADALAAAQSRFANLKARWDAARTTDEMKNIWANADRYDADSAADKTIRHTLIARSRLEINNNGYSDGIAQTSATDLIGCGPSLRMQTGSDGFNRMIETTWDAWCKAVKFRRKLWCMAHAKHSDGEAFGVLRRNPGVRHKIKLDLVLHEAEQVQTPQLPFGDPNYIDGIKFDQFGNPQWYDILKQHPGTNRALLFNFIPEQVPAQFVLHWFKLRRPGQHRAVPEMSSTLNIGAASRRWREATLAAAETAADFTLFLKTQQTPDEMDTVTPMSTLDIEKRMMTALPAGYDPMQMKAEHPGATYESFHKTQVNEQARPKSMPFNKAACDSSSYNYASGRLDHQTYYAALDVEREDCNDLVLDPLFSQWFDLAVMVYGWLGGNPAAITDAAKSHIWDWPKHRVADVEAEANANETKLKSGQVFLTRQYSDAGLDLEDEITAIASALGVDEEVIRTRLLDITLPPPTKAQPVTPGADEGMAAPVAPASTKQNAPQASAALETLNQVIADWVTLDNGVHVDIGPDGTISKGPPGMVGKKPSDLNDAHKSSTRAKEATDRALEKLRDEHSNPNREEANRNTAKAFREAHQAHKDAAAAHEKIGDKGMASIHERSAREAKRAAVLHENIAKVYRNPTSKESSKIVRRMMSSDSRFSLNGNGVHHEN